MLGTHCVRHWSTTQTTLALSSAESELHGIAKGASIGMGLRSIGGDLGLNLRIMILTDASAALGIVRRRGLGKIRHLDVTDLWLQEKARNKDIEIAKIPGDENLADALTKYIARPTMVKHLCGMNSVPEMGRPETAPMLSA